MDVETLVWMAIPLTQGLFALVNSEDFEELSKHKWYAHISRNKYYACRQASRKNNNGKRVTIWMHCCVLSSPIGYETDHHSGDTLDNRRDNLRVCTHAENCRNQQNRPCSSKYKGVRKQKVSQQKWTAQIKLDGKQIHLGCFDDEIKAARAYNIKAKELFGEFARLNNV